MTGLICLFLSIYVISTITLVFANEGDAESISGVPMLSGLLLFPVVALLFRSAFIGLCVPLLPLLIILIKEVTCRRK